MSTYLKNKVLNENLQAVYVALINNGKEVTKTDYKRQKVTFAAASDGQTSNNIDVLFPIAEEAWGDITEIVLFDNEIKGNELFRSTPEIIKNIEEASQYKIPVNYLIVRLR
jgi:hypothetical protein